MADAHTGLPVPGSRRHPLPEARRIGDAPPDEEVLVTVVLRTGAGQPEADRVWQFASAAGLEVAGVNLAARAIRLRGTVAAMNTAFGVSLGTFVAGARTYRGREGSVYIPESLDGAIVAVLGLDSRPQARPHFRYAPGYAIRPDAMAPRVATAGLSVPQIGSMYDFPPDATGAGQTVAIIELGGGYTTPDLEAYFGSLGLPMPVIDSVGVDGAANSPGDDADGEVMLDIEVVGAVAPGARIVVYFAPNTTNGFYDAIAAAMHDAARTPSVISISWGQAESGWTASAMDAYDALFADAAALGITIYAAAGDDGATDGGSDGELHVDFPASSPSVVGCGGTRLSGTSEVVWNELASGNGATGGGFSAHFAVPDYQRSLAAFARADGRGVPDVAGNADPLTGYQVRVDGQDVVIGGTSAVAPLWAGLTALINAARGTRLGDPHAEFYAATVGFRDIVSGGNGGFEAAPGWDPCTGLGSPDGAVLADPE
jgi:kumamolisin